MTYPNFTDAILYRIARPSDRMAELDALIAAGCPDPDLSDLTAEDFEYVKERPRLKCQRGHSLTGENAVYRQKPDGRHYRVCRACLLAGKAKNRARKRGKK